MAPHVTLLIGVVTVRIRLRQLDRRSALMLRRERSPVGWIRVDVRPDKPPRVCEPIRLPVVPIRNLAVPNEDARAIDLEDSNLFALNRFPGYDRVEDGTRVTWGVDWELQRPGWRIKTTIGTARVLDRRASTRVERDEPARADPRGEGSSMG